MSPETVGLIAGGGQFPFLIADEARASGLRVAAVGFSGHTDASLSGRVDAWSELHIGQLSKLLRFFKDKGVSSVVFAGAVSKPKAMDVRPDFKAVKLLFKLKTKGDDAILRAVADELESEGMRVVSPLEIVPGIGTPAGVLTSRRPRKHEWEDLEYAWPRARAMGRMDIGQSLVVKSGMVVAVEGLEGTDETLLRAGRLAGPGCVAVKVLKPGQDERIDLPAVGAKTIESMIKAQAVCLGIEAEHSLFFDMRESVDRADKAGISVVGLSDEVLASRF
ncbi:MAG: UDP-2,3-diacylglucosamine diphosphatase LpxI [Thermodesulfobacteriota bacterium]|nr:UDP-2,3-diacylglucosamine diphosphatase LpxI [Thermodesulfobacteriota bacterium]